MHLSGAFVSRKPSCLSKFCPKRWLFVHSATYNQTYDPDNQVLKHTVEKSTFLSSGDKQGIDRNWCQEEGGKLQSCKTAHLEATQLEDGEHRSPR